MEDCAAVRENSGFSLQTVRASVMKLLRNRAYILFLILIGIAAFGFTVTHFAMGIDDFGIGHYMDLSPDSSNNMLQHEAAQEQGLYSVPDSYRDSGIWLYGHSFCHGHR